MNEVIKTTKVGGYIMKKRDLQIIIAVLVLALGGLVARSMWDRSDGPEDYVRIYVGSEEYKRVSLSNPQIVVVERDDKYNEVEITDHSVKMKAANCDNQDCIHQGEITLENVDTRILGNWIVCLPNQVSIELVKSEDEGQ